MFIKQISVFIENKLGKLSKLTDVLGKNNIDIYALTIADTTDFGILRMIVNDPDKATEVIKETGMIVKCTDVIAVTVEDKPGGLTHTLETLENKGINVEYIYAFIGKNKDGATVVIKVDKPQEAVDALGSENNIELVEAESLYR